MWRLPDRRSQLPITQDIQGTKLHTVGKAKNSEIGALITELFAFQNIQDKAYEKNCAICGVKVLYQNLQCGNVTCAFVLLCSGWFWNLEKDQHCKQNEKNEQIKMILRMALGIWSNYWIIKCCYETIIIPIWTYRSWALIINKTQTKILRQLTVVRQKS